MAKDQTQEILAAANDLNDKIQECEVILRRLNALVKQTDNHDLKFYCLTELGDRFLGNNSVGRTVEKVIEKIKG